MPTFVNVCPFTQIKHTLVPFRFVNDVAECGVLKFEKKVVAVSIFICEKEPFLPYIDLLLPE